MHPFHTDDLQDGDVHSIHEDVLHDHGQELGGNEHSLLDELVSYLSVSTPESFLAIDHPQHTLAAWPSPVDYLSESQPLPWESEAMHFSLQHFVDVLARNTGLGRVQLVAVPGMQNASADIQDPTVINDSIIRYDPDWLAHQDDPLGILMHEAGHLSNNHAVTGVTAIDQAAELQADDFAMRQMLQSGISPDAFIRGLSRLQADSQHPSGGLRALAVSLRRARGG